MPAVGFPSKMQGLFVSALRLDAVTKDPATGIFTVSSTVGGDLHTGKTLEDFNYRLTNRMTNVAPSDQFLSDNVAEEGDFEIVVTEKRLVTAVSIVDAIMFGGFSYVRVQRSFLPPGATNPQVFIAIAAISESDGGRIERGPLNCSLTGVSAGVSPAIVSAGGSLPF